MVKETFQLDFGSDASQCLHFVHPHEKTRLQTDTVSRFQGETNRGLG